VEKQVRYKSIKFNNYTCCYCDPNRCYDWCWSKPFSSK